MAVEYISEGSPAAGAAALTVGLPATRQTDDLLLLLVETANQAVTITGGDAANWLAVPSSPQGTGTAGGTAATRLSVFYRRVDGTEANPGVGDSGDHQIAQIINYRGVDTANPFNANAGSTRTTAGTSVTFPSVTTTVDNCMVLLIEAHSLPDTNSTTITSGQANANLSAITERTDENTNAGNGGGFSLAEGTKVSAGATGTSSATVTTSSVGGMITLALRPAPDAQALTPARYDNSNTVFAPTVAAGAVSLTGSLVQNTSLFYAANITQSGGSQGLVVGLFSNGQSFYGPSVSTLASLSAARFDNAPSFYGPTLASSYGLTAARYDNGHVFFSAALTTAATLSAARFDNGSTVFAPVLSAGSSILAPDRFDAVHVFYAPSVAPGAVGLGVSRLDNAAAFYPATVGAGGTLLQPARFDNAASVYAPTVAPGAFGISALRYDNASQLFAPAVASGAVALQPQRFDNASAFFSPSVSDIPPQHITFGDWVDSGWVQPGWVGWPYFNAPQFFAAGLAVGAPPQPSQSGGGMGVPLRFVPFTPVRANRSRKRRQSDLVLLS